ncbi:MAG: hypothetical protein ACH350_02790 [Parachlamydiaceae bacterium]
MNITSAIPGDLKIAAETQSSTLCGASSSCLPIASQRIKEKKITLDNIEATPKEIDELNKRVVPALSDTHTSRLGWFKQFLPGHKQRQSENAALIFSQYLEEKYGKQTTSNALKEIDWETMKQNLLVKDILDIKQRAERHFLKESIANTQMGGIVHEGDMYWIVQDGRWNPQIKVKKSPLEEPDDAMIQDFNPAIIEDQLKKQTEANPEQITAVIEEIKSQILQSHHYQIMISSKKVDDFLIQEIAAREIPINSPEQFNRQRMQSIGLDDSAQSLNLEPVQHL